MSNSDFDKNRVESVPMIDYARPKRERPGLLRILAGIMGAAFGFLVSFTAAVGIGFSIAGRDSTAIFTIVMAASSSVAILTAYLAYSAIVYEPSSVDAIDEED